MDKLSIKEKDNLYYNEVYKEGGGERIYFKHYKESIYYPIWYEILQRCMKRDNVKILDIGCGPGQVAQMFLEAGIKNYFGIDFSEEALSMAQKRVESLVSYPEKMFLRENITSSKAYSKLDYNTVFMLEVLEHIEKDILILKKIKENSILFISVPNFEDNSHIRKFKNEREIEERYGEVIDIQKIDRFCAVAYGDNQKIIREPLEYYEWEDLSRFFLIEGYPKQSQSV